MWKINDNFATDVMYGNYYIMAKGKEKTDTKKIAGLSAFMNIKTDFGFKKTFGDKTLLIAFLNAILNRKIADIEYLQTEQLGYIKENRKAVYDVYCTGVTGERFIVEMQASPQPYFMERILFYMAYPVISQAPKGKVTGKNSKGEEVKIPWDYSISGVYMICILDSIIFPEEKAKDTVTERLQIVRKEANETATGKWEVITIELPKFDKTEDDLETDVDKWLYSIKNMEKLSECPKNFNEGIFRELYEKSKINNLTEREMKTYGKSIWEYDDVILGMRRSRDEGREEGRNEGIKEGISKLVRNCYKNGKSIVQIAEFTGVPEKEIKTILEIVN
jgi:predicted transposase/invertase (TIGR01784 family)